MNLKGFIRSCSGRVLIIALLVSFVHGLIYVFLIPPWQHYDEPNHFEYAWLVAKRSALPQPGDYDQSMRRGVAISMINHGFFRGLNFLPDLQSENEPIWIGGYSQLSNPPLYYALAALPLRLFKEQSITRLLYLARMVSLLFLLVTILAAWGIMNELTHPGNPLRIMVPVTLALLPGFADLMTSVNNDVGAIALFSVALWGSIRIIKRGFSPLTVLITAAAVGLCFLVKETAYFSLPVFILALLFALLPGHRWLVWIIFTLGVIAILITGISWGDASLWYRSTSQVANTRQVDKQAVLGEHVFRLDTGAEVTPTWLVPLFQPVPELTGKGLKDRVFTLGAWMWASEPVEASTPILNDGKQAFFSNVSLGTQPAFYTVKVKLSSDPIHRVWVSLSPLQPIPGQNVVVYYDGLVLAEGDRSAADPPVFRTEDGRQGTWGGALFTNLLRNGSAEEAGPRVRSWADQLGAKFLPDQTRPSLVLTYLLDWKGAQTFYRGAADRLFRSFWGLFGWAHVPLKGYRPYYFLLLATAIAAVGFLAAIWRRRFKLPWPNVLLLFLTLVLIWGMTFVRGASYLAVPSLYFPVARYAYPAIIPTAMLFCIGWLEVLGLPGKWILWPAWMQSRIYLSLFLLLDLLAFYSIYLYYYRA